MPGCGRTTWSTLPRARNGFPTGTRTRQESRHSISRIRTSTRWRYCNFLRTRAWRNGIGQRDKLFLGIDHTAIVVRNTDASLQFYRDLLGMQVAGESENYGNEQEHLNNVFGARLRITALRGASGPASNCWSIWRPRRTDFPIRRTRQATSFTGKQSC